MKRFWLSVALVSMLGLASACSDDNGSNPGPGPDTPNLEDEFGGYTSSNEEPAFGDPAIELLADAEVDIVDEMASDPAVVSLGSAPGAQVYIMAIRWGQLGEDPAGDPGDGSLGDTFVWNGSLEIDRGALVVTRVVAFERGDRVVTPRSDPRIIEWESATGADMDGIRVVIWGPNDNIGTEPTVTFNTPLFSKSFTLSELADLDEIDLVDDAGNQVHFLARQTDAVASVGGFVSGRWGWKEGDEFGTFAGVWIGSGVGVRGWVRGHFGTNDQGEDVFFGKYIDSTGNFRGFLRGDVGVGQGDLHNGVGRFVGDWLSATRDNQGRVAGRWVVSEGGRGLFDGTWCADCQ